jgi:hypothetical protein
VRCIQEKQSRAFDKGRCFSLRDDCKYKHPFVVKCSCATAFLQSHRNWPNLFNELGDSNGLKLELVLEYSVGTCPINSYRK